MPDTPDSPYQLTPAGLYWTEEEVPLSEHFGDVYFSRDNGLEETRHVFLRGNRLRERWMQLDPRRPDCFCIGETGFGTGLNFLAAWQLWRRSAPRGWRLHLVSAEKHPLTPQDLQRALAPWSELEEFAAALQANYPPLLPGQHRLLFDDGAVVLDLLFGDAAESFQQVLDTTHPQHAFESPVKMDAWFLDGFAPAANPAMWREELFTTLSLLGRPGITTAATFTAAGIVKRALQDNGFEVSKTPGWGTKRDSLTAVFTRPSDTPLPQPDPVPWHLPPKPADKNDVAVIGAGLAGSHTALALAQRGIAVTVLERHDIPAGEASGNPQGILYTRLSNRLEILNQFTLASFLFALRHYAPWLQSEDLGRSCGVLQLMQSARERRLLAVLQELLPGEQEWVRFVDAETASSLAGVAIAHPAVYYPHAGWLRPPQVCAHALDHPGITLKTGVEIAALEEDGNHWLLRDSRGSVIQRASAVVVATSTAAAELAPCEFLPLKAIRGQLSYLDRQQFTATPQAVICHDGYLAPPDNDTITLGATFDLHHRDSSVRDDDHDINLQQLDSAVPGLLRPGAKARGGRAALRCTSPDYLPVVGSVPDVDAFARDYAPLRKNAKTRIDQAGRYHRGLYINTAHGSRGLTSTPLCAQLIASLICSEPRPLPAPLMRALSPARFVIRDLIRKRF